MLKITLRDQFDENYALDDVKMAYRVCNSVVLWNQVTPFELMLIS